MTPDQARRGIIELVLPEGGRVLVDFGDGSAASPEIEAAVVQMMLDAEGSDDDIREALVDYAHVSGLSAEFIVGRGSMIVALGEPD